MVFSSILGNSIGTSDLTVTKEMKKIRRDRTKKKEEKETEIIGFWTKSGTRWQLTPFQYYTI